MANHCVEIICSKCGTEYCIRCYAVCPKCKAK